MSTTDNDKSKDSGTTPATTKPAKEKPHHSTRHAKKTPHNLVTPLLVLIIIASGLGGVWLSRNMQQYNVQQQDAINVLRDQVQASQQQADKQVKLLQERLVRQQQSQDELRDNLSTLLKRNEHLRKDWLLGEAEYLIKLASYRLQLERDITTALRAMQAADERLRDVGDPAVLAVRKVLAEDQTALKNVPVADITGMSLTLSALIANVDKLPLSTPAPESPQAPAETANNINISNWRELPAAIWQTLKGLVVIRHHDENLAHLLSPKEHFYLLQDLHLQLEQARLALLLGKADVFVERIKAANEWLTRFFDQKDASVQNTQQTLTQLLAVNIEPEIPSIDKSYQALKSYLAGVPIKINKEKEKPAPAVKKVPEVKKAPVVKKATEVKEAPKVEKAPAAKVTPPPADKAADNANSKPATAGKVQP